MPSDDDDSDNSVRVRDYSYSPDHTAQSIKDVAKDIRGTTSNTRELIHTLLNTGVIGEIARTILETTIAIRDTANEINYVVKDVKERGIVRDTASAIADTSNAALNTVDIAKREIDTKKNNEKNMERKKRKKIGKP